MSCVLIHAVWFPPYIEFPCIYCASLHVLYFPACIVYRFMYCIFLHVLCAVFVCCFIYCILLHALCSVLCIAFCFIHAKSHFGHISGFLTIYIQNFFVLRINNLYFPFLLDIKSLTSLIYVQFSSDSIAFPPTLSLILDISCNFLFFISNSYPAQFFSTCTVLDFGHFLLFSHNYVQSR